jgi:ribosomal protein L29
MKEIKKKDDKALSTYLAEKREEIRAVRFGVGTRNVKALRDAKKEVARALFEMGTRAKADNK